MAADFSIDAAAPLRAPRATAPTRADPSLERLGGAWERGKIVALCFAGALALHALPLLMGLALPAQGSRLGYDGDDELEAIREKIRLAGPPPTAEKSPTSGALPVSPGEGLPGAEQEPLDRMVRGGLFGLHDYEGEVEPQLAWMLFEAAARTAGRKLLSQQSVSSLWIQRNTRWYSSPFECPPPRAPRAPARALSPGAPRSMVR